MSVKAWNDEQEAELIKLYTEEDRKDVHELAEYFSKGYRSVISKLVQLKIYEKPEINDADKSQTVKIMLRDLEEILDIRVDGTNLNKKEIREKCISLLNDMGIPLPEKRVDEYPHSYSGGMRQRAMIAMAMACNPKILIADEPTTALDVTIQAQIFELMDKLKKENDTAIILITHDMGVVAELADNVAVMYMGNIVEAGTADDVLRRPTHPYTKALLESVPVLGRGKNQDINPIKGSTPDPYNRPIGCQFAPRCNWQTESCDVMPEITQINETHQVRCHKYEQFFEKYK